MIFSDEEVEQDSGRSEAEEDAEPEHSPSTDAIPVSKINSSSAQLILVYICWLQLQFWHFVTSLHPGIGLFWYHPLFGLLSPYSDYRLEDGFESQ